MASQRDISPSETAPLPTDGDLESENAESTQGKFDIEDFGDTQRRFFAVEFVGAFLQCLMSDLFRWTEHYQFTDAFKALNPGWSPLVNMTCSALDATGSACSGSITHPLAGSALPKNYMFGCVSEGFLFIICSMSAPGATILPQFAIMYALAGMKDYTTVAVALLGQLAGCAFSNFILWWLLKDAVAWQTQIFKVPVDEVNDFVERVLGLQFPEEQVSNEYAFLYSCMSGAMLVFLIVPMVHRCLPLHPLARDAAKGVAMAVFQAGFGQNGLGSMPNPSQWLATAVFLECLGHRIWSKHGYYALIVPLWAPISGICIGAVAYRVYLALLHFGKVDVPVYVKPSAKPVV